MSIFVDTHLHLGREEFAADREAVIERARAAGVCAFLHVGYDRATIDAALNLADTIPSSWASAGIHPHDAASYDDEIEARLRSLAEAGRIVAIGECGLDFFRDLSPRAVQETAFRRQIRLAAQVDLPMIFHVRDAYAEARELLEEEGLPARRGVFHAFAGDAEFAAWAVEAGFKLGIGGPLTYKKSKLPEAIAGLPASSFVLETDAPWLPPQPWRGKRNEPAYLRVVANRLAEMLELEVDGLADTVAATVSELFGIELGELNQLRASDFVTPER